MGNVTGKVAAIVDERELVINRGEEHGVTVGMRFAVLAGQGTEILDPDTGEALGSVPIDKATVKVVRVQPRLSVARTFRTVGGSPGLLPGVNLSAMLSGTRPRPEELRYTETGLRESLDETDLLIKIGDYVVETKGAEYSD